MYRDFSHVCTSFDERADSGDVPREGFVTVGVDYCTEDACTRFFYNFYLLMRI